MASLSSLVANANVLDNFAFVGASPDLGALVAPKLPMVHVGSQRYTGKIWVEADSQYMGGPQNLARAPGSPYPQIATLAPSTVTYECEPYLLAGDLIPTLVESRSQVPMSERERSAAQVYSQLVLGLESRAATLFQTTSNWGDTAAVVDLGGGGVQWSTHSTAKPDYDLAKLRVRARQAANGRNPDTLILSQPVLDAYCLCLQSMSINGITSGMANGDILTDEDAITRIKRIHKVNVLVGGARYNSVPPGATASDAYLWTDTIWMGCLNGGAPISTAGGIRTRAIAGLLVIEDGSRTMSATYAPAGGEIPVNVQTYEITPPAGKGIVPAAELMTDEVALLAQLGVTATDALA